MCLVCEADQSREAPADEVVRGYITYVRKQNRIILHRISMNNLGKRKEENELYQRLNDKQTQGCYIK